MKYSGGWTPRVSVEKRLATASELPPQRHSLCPTIATFSYNLLPVGNTAAAPNWIRERCPSYHRAPFYRGCGVNRGVVRRPSVKNLL